MFSNVCKGRAWKDRELRDATCRAAGTFCIRAERVQYIELEIAAAFQCNWIGRNCRCQSHHVQSVLSFQQPASLSNSANKTLDRPLFKATCWRDSANGSRERARAIIFLPLAAGCGREWCGQTGWQHAGIPSWLRCRRRAARKG
jgi:hypothetical protein